MKRILFTLFAAALTVGSASGQTGYGIKAGLNLPKIHFNGNNTTVMSDISTNFYISGYADLSVGSNFSIQPGISLQGKGAKFKSDSEIFEIEGNEDATLNLMSIEVPINAVYYIPTGAVGSVFVGAGPYAGYVVSGKAKSGNVSEDIPFGSALGEMKRFDYGANFLAGYKLSNGFLFNAGYGLGLANVWNLGDGVNVTNRVLSFGVGFQF